MTTETMICLVSDQTAPNLLAGLAPKLNVGSVVLVASSEMTDQARRLDLVFKRHGKQCRIQTLDSPYDARGLKVFFDRLLKNEDRGTCIVNVTGGTKLMALAAASVAHSYNIRCVYVQQSDGQAQWLDSNRPPEVLAASLSCDDLLTVYGFRVIGRSGFDPGQAARSLADRLAVWATEEVDLVPALNKLTHVNKKPKNRNKRTEPFFLNSVSCRVKKVFSEPDATSLVDELTEDQVIFKSDYARAFFCGEWLELAVENAVRRLPAGAGLVDIQRGVNVRTDTAGVENELDIVFVRGRTLHVIECKTANYNGPQGLKGSDLMYKLADQKKYGGLTTKRLLISHHELKPPVQERANELGIDVIAGPKLGNLDVEIRKWLDA